MLTAVRFQLSQQSILMNLQSKILLILIPMVVLPLLGLGWIAYDRLRIIAEMSSHDQMKTMLDQVALNIESNLNTSQANVELFSSSNLIRNYMLAQEDERYGLLQLPLLKLFSSYHKTYPEYYEIRVLLPDGYEDTRYTEGVSPNATEEEKDTPYFRRLRDINAPSYSTLFWNLDNEEYAFLIAQKLMLVDTGVDDSTEVAPSLKGYLAITLRLDFIKRQVQNSRFGKAGSIFFTNEHGKILFARNDLKLPPALTNVLLSSLRKQINTETIFTLPLEQQSFLFKGKQLHPQLFVFAAVPEQELLAESHSLGWIVTGIIILAIILTISLLFSVLNYLLIRPIHQLSITSEKIGRGDLVHLKDGSSGSEEDLLQNNDELGVLARSFHKMGLAILEKMETIETYSISMEEKNETLRQMDQLKDTFLANTSHELRTPLHGIIGLTESLIDGVAGSLPQTANDNLLMIAQSSKRLANLVNDILDFSKMKNHDLQLKRKGVDVKSITDVVIAISKPLIGQKPVNLINDLPKDISLVDADEDRLEQILLNLVCNGIKFTNKGSVRVTAEVISESLISSSLSGEGGAQLLKIKIIDTGIGIPAEKLGKIFDPFEQVDGSTSRLYGGTGLGLTVTKQLVELHGGKLEVESSEGLGSAFSFTLPIKKHAIQMQPSAQAKQHQFVQVKGNKTPIFFDRVHKEEVVKKSRKDKLVIDNQNGKTILVVDDEPVNVQVLKNQLTLKGYTVLTADDGFQALDILECRAKENEPLDLILLDLMMPRMSGYEVCQKVREQFDIDTLPIVMVTARNQVVDLTNGFENGVNDYMVKPFRKEELLARVCVHIKIKDGIKATKEKERLQVDIMFRKIREKQQEQHHQAMEQKAQQLSSMNTELQAALIDLKSTQNQLVQSGKMSALGSLVAGVAHEINTPIGNGIMMSSKLKESAEEIEKLYEDGEMTRKNLADYFELTSEGNNLILSNLMRAGKLVRIFKQVDANQLEEKSFIIRVKEYLEGILVSLDPQNLTVTVNCEEPLEIDTYPLAFVQVVTNLILNSVLHGFVTGEEGHIQINVEQKESLIDLRISDDGKGISKKDLEKIFDPFFTTKRGMGMTGLGLHIVFNIITQKMKGTIRCESTEGRGTTFILQLPMFKD